MAAYDTLRDHGDIYLARKYLLVLDRKVLHVCCTVRRVLAPNKQDMLLLLQPVQIILIRARELCLGMYDLHLREGGDDPRPGNAQSGL